ncbi:ABC transporter permease [Alteribacillus iranensis]|uniref:ABC-2 type transport system permease protein n=1 Tax=Alteribacillus iranensis TaxID=930128 RepID=A0A1I1Z8L0_9BACI|nr:ABC transporter permease [Alteribacillus iranensis]SFE26670.1 ABC-2 type transport system permease protein [Alteribacillus iranensis]
MSGKSLWGNRVQHFWNEAIRYLRLIGNSGFMFSLYALFLAGGYFYPSFIEWLPASFPVHVVFILLFTYLLTRSPIRTFLKEGDLVFLLPLEKALTSYFRRSIVYSAVMQSVGISVLFLLLGPLFQDRVSTASGYMLTAWLVLLAANFWNNGAKWGETHIRDERSRKRHQWGRAVINLVLTYFLFIDAPLWFTGAVLVIMLCLYVAYYSRIPTQHLLNWELLLSMEAERLSAFYRFVQSFTDVPYVKPSVKRRRVISKLTDRVIWNQHSTYTVLFTKAFIRSGEYFGMYIRLLFAGGLVMYAFPSDWVKIATALLFIYMTGVQLKTLWHHLDTTIWPDLYPTSLKEKERSFQQIVKILLVTQTVMFFFVYWLVGSLYILAVVILLGGIALSLYYPRKGRGRHTTTSH